MIMLTFCDPPDLSQLKLVLYNTQALHGDECTLSLTLSNFGLGRHSFGKDPWCLLTCYK